MLVFFSSLASLYTLNISIHVIKSFLFLLWLLAFIVFICCVVNIWINSCQICEIIANGGWSAFYLNRWLFLLCSFVSKMMNTHKHWTTKHLKYKLQLIHLIDGCWMVNVWKIVVASHCFSFGWHGWVVSFFGSPFVLFNIFNNVSNLFDVYLYCCATHTYKHTPQLHFLPTSPLLENSMSH